MQAIMPEAEVTRPLWQNAVYFAVLVGILVFANWGAPPNATGLWGAIYDAKWAITGALGIALAAILVFWLEAAWWKVALAALFTAIVGTPVSGESGGSVRGRADRFGGGDEHQRR